MQAYAHRQTGGYADASFALRPLNILILRTRKLGERDQGLHICLKRRLAGTAIAAAAGLTVAGLARPGGLGHV
jgi:hypothetical protein